MLQKDYKEFKQFAYSKLQNRKYRFFKHGVADNELEEKSKIILLFPFSCSWEIKFCKTAKALLEKNDWEIDERLLNNQSRILNYVLNAFCVDKEVKEKKIALLCKKRNDSFLGYHNFLQPNEKNNDKERIALYPLITLTKEYLVTFKNNVGFWGLEFTVDGGEAFTENSLYYLFEILLEVSKSLRVYNEAMAIANCIKSASGKKKARVKFFEEKEKEGDGNTRLRTILYSSIYLTEASKRSKGDVASTAGTDFHIFEENFRVPYWGAGVCDYKNIHSAKKKSGRNVGCFFESFSLAATNMVCASVEGCCNFNFIPCEDKDLRRYANSNVYNFFQHTFLEYILVLHQIYSIQSLIARVEQPEKEYPLESHKLRAIQEGYVDFKKDFFFQHVSAVHKYQALFVYMEQSLGEKALVEEIEHTVSPITMSLNSRREQQRSKLVACLSVLAIIDLFFVLWCVTNESGRYVSKTTQTLVTCGFIGLGLITVGCIVILLCTFRPIRNFFDNVFGGIWKWIKSIFIKKD